MTTKITALQGQPAKSRSEIWQTLNRLLIGSALPHIILLLYTFLAMFPIVLTIINSFKERKNIFAHPYALPLGNLFSLSGYQLVFNPDRANTGLYLQNSLIVTVSTIVAVILFGAMAAYALSEYEFPGNRWLGLYMSIGIMIPIRLGTVGIIRICTALGLTGTLQSLVLIYIAQNLPLAIFILSQFMRDLPRELKDAARVDGASEYHIFFRLVLPLVRPGIASVAVFTMIPTWNDLWFPLILASQEETRTVTLGVQMFTGQFLKDWTALLAALTLAMLPVLIIYALFSRQMIRGLTSGAVKQ
jgi:raffinose/stachyose/melibiose transport system permease protein